MPMTQNIIKMMMKSEEKFTIIKMMMKSEEKFTNTSLSGF